MKVIQASGSRKRAIAKCTLRLGTGIVRVNSQLLYSIKPDLIRDRIEEPITLAGDVAKQVDLLVRTSGGGVSSCAEAARLAIAKALAQYDKNLQQEFLDYDRNLLVADVRLKETHKPNRHGKARAKRQKSYR
ncbi:MAG: 30S ribosomal protein S9 [Candidatus Woesearchaeota archaeon]|jgi:small subunit ribosomal protein S9|nr:30S ribosomal protein S9 [Candidatus Woesearchaeota archaeon]MDP7198802.1 30S ribosomal protein S9 [Candidatus Woesearchaeota archaeon]MDP7467198.1 30S ribosomal protein S9 [Candidatus Woesearchaeota archaeon]MDP7647467.1 30S ribosomal protein S9 [Candidatus Woesearchaeota archaeon]|tara:strand:+ start:382 stop:777 length:396 start_codon:yes stop_codon:yes gene_type:complete